MVTTRDDQIVEMFMLKLTVDNDFSTRIFFFASDAQRKQTSSASVLYHT